MAKKKENNEEIQSEAQEVQIQTEVQTGEEYPGQANGSEISETLVHLDGVAEALGISCEISHEVENCCAGQEIAPLQFSPVILKAIQKPRLPVCSLSANAVTHFHRPIGLLSASKEKTPACRWARVFCWHFSAS
jgi:hypothetical protein